MSIFNKMLNELIFFITKFLMTKNVLLNPRQKDLSVYPDNSYCKSVMLTDKSSSLCVSNLLLLLLLCFNKFPVVQ